MDIITLLGPTASGKTALAVLLADILQAEIISADSRQIYRRMNIGTGKDLEEYSVNRHPIPYHLIDICEPGYKYNLYEYQRDFNAAYNDIRNRHKIPLLCGGTGLYIETVLKGYSMPMVPENKPLRESLANKSLSELEAILKTYKVLHNKTDIDTTKRAIRAIEIAEYYKTLPPESRQDSPLDSYIIGIDIDRELRRKRISARLRARLDAGMVDEVRSLLDEGIPAEDIDRELRRKRISARLRARLDAGMVDEVRSLLDEGIPAEDLIYYGLEYKYLTEYILGKYSFDEMTSLLEIAIHQFAKRQMTWFRGMERRGFTIHWVDGKESFDVLSKKIAQEIKGQI